MKSLGIFLFFVSLSLPVLGGEDPYAFEETMPDGPFKGEVLDTSEKRAVVWLGTKRFANFYHRGRFWIGSYPAEAVQDVIFQIERWANAGPAAHIQLRFRLKPTHLLRLVPQNGRATRPVQVRDIIVSAEATYAVGRSHEYEVLAGLQQKYGITARAVSLDEKVQRMRRDRDFRIEQVRLNLSDDRKNLLLDTALHMSWRMAHSEMYDTLRNSCTTFAFDVLDDVASHRGWRRWASRLDQIPVLSRFYLFSRGLVLANGGSRLPDLQEEIWGKWKTPAACEGAAETLSALGSTNPDRE